MGPSPDLLYGAPGVGPLSTHLAPLGLGQSSHLLFHCLDLLQAGCLPLFQLLLVTLQGLCHLGSGKRQRIRQKAWAVGTHVYAAVPAFDCVEARVGYQVSSVIFSWDRVSR